MTGVNLWSGAQHARTYLDRRDAIPHRVEAYPVLLELLPEHPQRVLDLGTGDGLLLDVVRDAHPEVDCVGVDFSTTMLDEAARRFAGGVGVTFVQHDLDQPLPGLGGFDAVVSGFAIHHLVDERKRALFGEVFQLLEPGGVFCNLEHVASPTARLHDAFLDALGRLPEDDDPSNKLAPVDEQLGWLRDAGFDDVDCFWKWRELALLAGVRPR